MKICRDRFAKILRFGRKNDGPWNECEIDHACYLPDDRDVDEIIAKIEVSERFGSLLREAVEKSFAVLPISPDLPPDGQLWEGQWYVPRWGCDTLASLIEDIETTMSGKAGSRS